MDVEVRHLRYFLAVAEEGGFSAASRRVHVAQQVLSAQIRQLEQAVGAPLFERTSQGVRLTEPGSALLAGARRTLASLDGALDGALAAARDTAHNRLTVGPSVAAGGRVPTEMLARFSAGHPAVRVELRTFDLTHPAAGLLDGSTDVAFVRPPVDAEGITAWVGASGRGCSQGSAGRGWRSLRVGCCSGVLVLV
jgi:DNA-binding transcriptional LysR family regulator